MCKNAKLGNSKNQSLGFTLCTGKRSYTSYNSIQESALYS